MIPDELHTSAVHNRENGEEKQRAFPWVDSSDESEGADINLVKKQPRTRHKTMNTTVHVYKSQGTGKPPMLEHNERSMYDVELQGNA